jgi:hypothetical protein
MQGADHSVVGHLLFPRDVRDRAADQLQPQPLMGILCAGCACRTNPTIGRRMVLISQVSKAFQANFNDQRPTEGWRMAQPQLPSVIVELADFVTTSCGNRPFLRTLDRDDDLPHAQFGLENEDFGQTQMWGILRELQKSRIQVGNAAENMSTLRRLALNLLRHEKPEKRDVHVKRLKDALDEKYLPKVLNS